jgi:hypothetical protein
LRAHRRRHGEGEDDEQERGEAMPHGFRIRCVRQSARCADR